MSVFFFLFLMSVLFLIVFFLFLMSVFIFCELVQLHRFHRTFNVLVAVVDKVVECKKDRDEGCSVVY